MTEQQKPHYTITTAISYPNGEPHIGHAYEAVATDAMARFKRLDGHPVFFLTGVDEHGLKMKQTAAKEGITPTELADRNTAKFIEMLEQLDVSYDDFIRTTEPRHHESVAEIWRRMEKAGDIYLAGYKGWYSVRDEAFYAESETVLGGNGIRLGPQGTPVEWTEEQTYFFRLSKYEKKLLKFYEENPGFIMPAERRNEVVSFVKGGLQDLSISRTTLDWGIPVPDAPGHIIYVWVDALTNYITAAGFPKIRSKAWKERWPAQVHIIGKDITRFHAVYWPAFLMSAKLPLPERVFGHGFLYNRGEKMSKSVGNVVAPKDLVDAYGVDQVRYYFLREVPFGQDGNITHEQMVNRINADLANDLGNLAQRSLSMIAKNCAGTIPEPSETDAADEPILAASAALLEANREAIDQQAPHKALDAIWKVVADTNKYFAVQEPWALKKTNPARMGTVLWTTAEVVRRVAILAQPYMPSSSAKLLDQLGVAAEDRSFDALAHTLKAGTKIATPQGVFPRYVEEEAAKAAAAS
ncbi:methionyl-tRNA synthetase [Rhodomicrobium vannielii ATCC 17100]|uniref:Methionine--tRNA ligase n=1 Tax=Rhodomicrobium vannielii (strain ATCC 17100 / DSM 162 / LMG 4299 / NCIMB 10020 / ATH 3.1.1) TaxID=648757 RepID=E3I3Z7_RHOVT|nr:methionine--tRNA ligase [Rhodomicrobium vannielii]ADP71560.1 methionyl-tRNA synthetase [Rhodomicrobium vannielii ATCC 17100]